MFGWIKKHWQEYIDMQLEQQRMGIYTFYHSHGAFVYYDDEVNKIYREKQLNERK
jgi:hypothetical protein